MALGRQQMSALYKDKNKSEEEGCASRNRTYPQRIMADKTQFDGFASEESVGGGARGFFWRRVALRLLEHRIQVLFFVFRGRHACSWSGDQSGTAGFCSKGPQLASTIQARSNSDYMYSMNWLIIPVLGCCLGSNGNQISRSLLISASLYIIHNV